MAGLIVPNLISVQIPKKHLKIQKCLVILFCNLVLLGSKLQASFYKIKSEFGFGQIISLALFILLDS